MVLSKKILLLLCCFYAFIAAVLCAPTKVVKLVKRQSNSSANYKFVYQLTREWITGEADACINKMIRESGNSKKYTTSAGRCYCGYYMDDGFMKDQELTYLKTGVTSWMMNNPWELMQSKIDNGDNNAQLFVDCKSGSDAWINDQIEHASTDRTYLFSTGYSRGYFGSKFFN